MLFLGLTLKLTVCREESWLALGIVLFVSGLCLLEIFSAILSSLQQVNVQTYQKGFQQLEEKILGLLRDASPHFKEQLSKQLNSVESQFMSVAINVLNGVLSRTTSLFTQTVMFLLYVLMWLLSPMTSQSGQAVFSIVRTYFMLSAQTSSASEDTCAIVVSLCRKFPSPPEKCERRPRLALLLAQRGSPCLTHTHTHK
ncbi:unnamed protein product [Effrenium voratum]|nr:unnamed protein product [Effrenium voratum]